MSACHQLSAGKVGHGGPSSAGFEEGALSACRENQRSCARWEQRDDGSGDRQASDAGGSHPGSYRLRFSRGRWLITIGVPDEAELLAQPPLDVALVRRLQACRW